MLLWLLATYFGPLFLASMALGYVCRHRGQAVMWSLLAAVLLGGGLLAWRLALTATTDHTSPWSTAAFYWSPYAIPLVLACTVYSIWWRHHPRTVYLMLISGVMLLVGIGVARHWAFCGSAIPGAC